jgi:hypothetical protein
VRGTFFVLGWIADTMPELIAEIARRGHEVASKGYYHRSMRAMTPGEFREDRPEPGKRFVEPPASGSWLPGSGRMVAPGRPSGPSTCSAKRATSTTACAQSWADSPSEPWRRFAHLHQFGERTLWEFPISSIELFGLAVPVAGGNWYRQLPPGWCGAPWSIGPGRTLRRTSCISTCGNSTPIHPGSARPPGSSEYAPTAI